MIAAPGIPRHAVDRPELRRRLDAAVEEPLTVVVAPAGSGKTVLLSQWAASRPDLRVGWIDVVADDDDPRHFLRKMLDALGVDPAELPAFLSLLALGGGGFGDTARRRIVAWAVDAAPTLIVLDDLHRLSNRAIVADLEWLVDQAPRSLRFVFSSRNDVVRGRTRHRLRFAVTELRESDLALDIQAATEVLTTISGSAPPDAAVTAIVERTEGWPAGVQLSGIALRRHPDAIRFAAGLTGDDRLIADFLGEEVLDALPPARRELLLRISALERMSERLLDAVLGPRDAEGVLASLEQSAMFLVPLDERGEWFRFHHLFRDLLRYRLRARLPGAEHAIAATAAEWFVAEGMPDAAIGALLDAQEWQSALDLILTLGREVYETQELGRVSHWLATIPDAVRRTRPEAEVLHGILLGVSGRAPEGEDVLRGVVTMPGSPPGPRLIAHCYIAARVQFRGDAHVALRAARGALEMLGQVPPDEVPNLIGITHPGVLATLAYGSAGRALLHLGEFAEARAMFKAATGTDGAHYSPYRVHLLGSRALLEAWTGRPRIAEVLAAEALELARGADLLLHPAPADAYLAKAFIALEQGDLAAALEAVGPGLLRARGNNRTQLVWVGLLARALTNQGVDDLADAPTGTAPPIVADRLRALHLRARRLGLAGTTVPIPVSEARVRGWSQAYTEQIAALLTAGKLVDARSALAAASPPPATEYPLARIEFLLLHAWLATLDGRGDRASARTREAVAIAQRQDLTDVFVRFGPIVEALLADVADVDANSLQRIRSALRASATASAPPRSASRRLAEPLTEREMDVLVHLPTRMTNADIAERNEITVNTVKTHLAHIYRKLDVRSRNAAVQAALEHGLLST
ncbi:LuxR C-terminal-related transcriptional regulator [Microbacterium sp. B2969]|uniref:LuxR C-terminal-related transcriptional regulator n=1 Tax=Microbacterium alkaliflavum TaxID=3248839 RepID=A0ABW7QE61_9MICO